MERKTEIRSRVRAIRGGLDEETRKRADILLTERILGHQWFYRSEILLSFASYGSEINTYEIIGGTSYPLYKYINKDNKANK